MFLKVLLAFGFVASAQASSDSDLLPGRYEFSGVSYSTTTAWRCQLGRWVKGRESHRQFNQTRPLEIKKIGTTLFADGQKLQMHTHENCSHYLGEFRNKYSERSSKITLQAGVPGACGLDGKISQSTMHVKNNLPALCEDGQYFETNQLKFVYGLELNPQGEVVWNPLPVKYTP